MMERSQAMTHPPWQPRGSIEWTFGAAEMRAWMRKGAERVRPAICDQLRLEFLGARPAWSSTKLPARNFASATTSSHEIPIRMNYCGMSLRKSVHQLCLDELIEWGLSRGAIIWSSSGALSRHWVCEPRHPSLSTVSVDKLEG